MRHTWREWSLITAAVKRRGRLSSGDRSLSRAHTLVSSWVQEGSVEGFPCRQRREPPDTQSRRNHTRDTAVGPGCRADQSRREVDEAAGEATTPHAPDFRGEGVRPPDSAPYLDPSFQNTAPPSQTPQHNESTRSPVYFGHSSPYGHFILLYLLNKNLSEAWRHTHCIRRLLFPPQYCLMFRFFALEHDKNKRSII